jgi:hypothetical protein
MAVIFIYFALFLAVHFTAKAFKNPGKARLFQLTACFLLLFGFFGFRDITVLNDTSHYYGFYYQRAHVARYLNETVFAYHVTDKFEYGFQVLCHILIKYVSKEPYTIIIFSSLVITLGELWFINRHTKDIAKVCFFFLIANLMFMHYCVIRQALAILFFYAAFEQLDKNTRKYHLLILCACMFHISAIFLFALPYIRRIQPSRRKALMAIAISVGLALTIFEVLSLLGLHDHPYYKAAIQRDSISIVGLADLALLTFILGICIWQHRRIGYQQADPTYFWMGVAAYCVSIVSLVFYPIARVNEYFWPFIILMLIGYLDTSRLLRLVAIGVFLFKMIGVNTFRPEWLHVDNYKFYDFEKRVHTYKLYPQEQ